RTQGNGPGVLRRVARYQLSNHLGSTMLELTHQAEIISYEENGAWGVTYLQAVRGSTETPKRYRYTGKERDEESGLYYHGARYFAPWLGRWVSCDPAGLVVGANVNSYAKANPIRFVDPSGRQSHPPAPPDAWVLDLNRDLGLDPTKNGQTPVIDLRPQAQPLSTPMSSKEARAYGNKQAK